MPQIITVTTDFGLEDHYAGTMKGVLLSRCPGATIVDISHAIPAFSIISGAYTVDQAAPYFPAGTVHLIVVDPGVGTARGMVVAEALGQLFVAPDNGVLTLIAARDPSARYHEITNSKLWLDSPSATFHGRDMFAPAAAAFASGAAKPGDAGPRLDQIQLLEGLEVQRVGGKTWRGVVLSVDHFGNLITNFPAKQFGSIDVQPFCITAGSKEIGEFRKTFGEAPRGMCFAYRGSSGYLEIGMNQQSAASFLGAAPGAPVSLSMDRPDGDTDKNERARYNLSNS